MRNTDLHELIHSLTPSEKRHFKLFAAMEKGNKQYMLVFDATQNQKTYDEEALNSMLKKLKIHNSLTKIKNYLYNLILKSLRVLPNQNKVRSEFIDLQRDIAVLRAKRLYEQCNSRIKKAKKVAEENHWITGMIQLNFYESDIRFLLKEPPNQRGIGLHFTQLLERIRLLDNLVRFDALYQKMMFLAYQGRAKSDRKIRREYEKIIRNPLMKSEANALSFYAKAAYYQCLAFYNWPYGSKEDLYRIIRKHFQWLEQNPWFINNNRFEYTYNVLLNLAVAAYYLNRFREVREIIAKIQNSGPLSKTQKETITFRILILQIGVCIKTGEFSKGKKIIEKGVPAFLNRLKTMEPVFSIALYMDYVSTYLGLKDFKTALHWCNRLLNESNSAQFPKHMTVIKILALLIHLELGNKKLLSSLLVSTKGFLIKNQSYTGFEQLILKTIKKIISASSESEEKGYYGELRKKIGSFKNRIGENVVMDYFDYASWAESKIQNRPFSVIVREKAKAFA